MYSVQGPLHVDILYRNECLMHKHAKNSIFRLDSCRPVGSFAHRSRSMIAFKIDQDIPLRFNAAETDGNLGLVFMFSNTRLGDVQK